MMETKEEGVLIINNIVIESREVDRFINATQLCKACGKKFNDWIRLETTKELIKTLETTETGLYRVLYKTPIYKNEELMYKY